MTTPSKPPLSVSLVFTCPEQSTIAQPTLPDTADVYPYYDEIDPEELSRQAQLRNRPAVIVCHGVTKQNVLLPVRYSFLDVCKLILDPYTLYGVATTAAMVHQKIDAWWQIKNLSVGREVKSMLDVVLKVVGRAMPKFLFAAPAMATGVTHNGITMMHDGKHVANVARAPTGQKGMYHANSVFTVLEGNAIGYYNKSVFHKLVDYFLPADDFANKLWECAVKGEAISFPPDLPAVPTDPDARLFLYFAIRYYRENVGGSTPAYMHDLMGKLDDVRDINPDLWTTFRTSFLGLGQKASPEQQQVLSEWLQTRLSDHQ